MKFIGRLYFRNINSIEYLIRITFETPYILFEIKVLINHCSTVRKHVPYFSRAYAFMLHKQAFAFIICLFCKTSDEVQKKKIV